MLELGNIDFQILHSVNDRINRLAVHGPEDAEHYALAVAAHRRYINAWAASTLQLYSYVFPLVLVQIQSELRFSFFILFCLMLSTSNSDSPGSISPRKVRKQSASS